MNKFKYLALSAFVFGICFTLTAPSLGAQVSVGINVGPAPVCPYGYFDYAPYDCAPYGYYGPDWFVGGIFIGAGPWFHGRAGFHGHVDNRFDPHHGYNGPEELDPNSRCASCGHLYKWHFGADRITPTPCEGTLGNSCGCRQFMA